MNDEFFSSFSSELEDISKNVHDSWMLEKASQGWQYGPEHQVENKLHPSMRPYEELPESEKEIDRATVRSVLQALLDMGFKIERE